MIASIAQHPTPQHATSTPQHNMPLLTTVQHSTAQAWPVKGVVCCLSLSVCVRRHNQALEQDTVSMQAEKLRLEQEALNLSKTLSAVMNDKFEIHRTEFDAETPIDKVLNMMHGLITKVRPGSSALQVSC